MPNRVALLRAEIEAAHPGARLKHRGEAGFSMSLPNGLEEHRYTTGPWHWKQTDEPWREIDTDLWKTSDPDWQWQVRSARFDTLLRPDGSRRFYPRRWVTDEWVEWGVPEWRAPRRWEALPVAGKKMQNRLVAAGEAVYEVGHTGRGSRTTLIIPHEGLARPLRWPVTFQGLHDQDGVLISDRDELPVGWLRPPWMADQDGLPRLVPWQIKAGRLLLDPDYAGLRFPVVVDPDYAIAAGADDGSAIPAITNFLATGVGLSVGYGGVPYDVWFRFAAIAANQAQDCTAASIAVVCATTSGNDLTSYLYGVDEDDHAAPTTYAEWNTDHGIHTTAAVTFNSTTDRTAGVGYSTPDLSAIFDELFARGSWATGNDAGIHWDGGASGGTQSVASYENTSYTEPILSLTLQTSVAHTLIGATTAAAGLTAGMKVGKRLAGAVSAAASTAGGLKLTKPLGGTVAAASTVAGALQVLSAHQLAGTVTAPTAVVADLKVGHGLDGAVQAAAAITGALTGTRQIAGTVGAAATVTGGLAVEHQLAGTISAASTVEGGLKIAHPLAGTVAAAATVTGDLEVGMDFDGTILAASTVSGDLTVGSQLAAAVNTISTVTGSLAIGHQLAGAVTAAASITGALEVGRIHAFQGTIAAAATIVATLQIGHPLTTAIQAVSQVQGNLLTWNPNSTGTVVLSDRLAGSVTTGEALAGTVSSVETWATVAAAEAQAGTAESSEALAGTVTVRESGGT